MPEQKNYIVLKQILDMYGQSEFLKSYGTIEDVYQIQMHFIYATCKMYDEKYSNNNYSCANYSCVNYSGDKTIKIKKD